MPESPNNKKVVRKKTAGARKAPSRATDNRSDRGRNMTGGGTRSHTRTGAQATGTISDTTAGNKGRGVGKAKASLSLKFTIPVALIVGAVIALLAVFLARMTTNAISNEILKSGVSQAAMLASFGKAIILKSGQLYSLPSREFLDVVSGGNGSSGNDKKDQKQEDRRGGAELPAWPVDLGLVGADEFNALASQYNLPGQKLDQLTPKSYVAAQKTWYAALKSGLLAGFITQGSAGADGKISHIQTQTLVAYILCNSSDVAMMYFDSGDTEKKNFPQKFLLARSETGNNIPDGKQGNLQIASSDWVPKYVNLREYNNGGKIQVFSTGDTFNPENPCEVAPGEIKLNDETYRILSFTMPIFDAAGKKVGEAILGLRAEDIVTQVAGINQLLWITGAAGVFMAIAVCFIVGMLVTRPVKTLIQDMSTVASGNLEHKTRAHSNDEIGLIAVEFNEMTRHLLIASKKEKEAARLENELEMACEIQMKLLPPRLPKIKGFDIYAVYHPAKEVGGDYYDFFPIDRRHVGIIVADVSGKGIPGSMVMATTRTILRFVASGNLSSADTLAKTNAMVAADIKRGMFVTAFYLVLDVLERTILCSSAGHNPMVIHHADGQVELINPNGIALGFDKGRIFSRTIKEQSIKLQVGDRIVLYTDGVVEAMNEKSEEYTDERFYSFVKAHNTLDSEHFVQALLADLNRHKGKADQHDDITIVTFRVV